MSGLDASYFVPGRQGLVGQPLGAQTEIGGDFFEAPDSAPT